ncbi:MAG: leucyl/phenylalanyl-tRNA--protein transferase [Sphingomonadales bacterium]
MPPLDPEMLLRAYTVGVFPMADSREAPSVYWVEPKTRAILPLDGFHLSKSLRKTLMSGRFEMTANRDFAGIVKLCAESVDNRPDTWINAQIEAAVAILHAHGHAHSIETWEDGRLVGGLYGISLGRGFFGESMVSRATDASKVALAHLVARLRAGGFTLLDCQFQTPHLESLGAIEIDRETYMELLDVAVGALGGAVGGGAGSAASASGDFGALDRDDPDRSPSDTVTVSGPTSAWRILHALAQTS